MRLSTIVTASVLVGLLDSCSKEPAAQQPQQPTCRLVSYSLEGGSTLTYAYADDKLTTITGEDGNDGRQLASSRSSGFDWFQIDALPADETSLENHY